MQWWLHCNAAKLLATNKFSVLIHTEDAAILLIRALMEGSLPRKSDCNFIGGFAPPGPNTWKESSHLMRHVKFSKINKKKRIRVFFIYS